MLVSSPLCEKTQMSAAEVPLAGRKRTTGFPVREQVFVAVANAPIAPTFKSTLLPGEETPAVVGSTTTMSLPVAFGAPLVRTICSSELFGAATTSATAFERVPSGFCTCTGTLPALATSAALTGAVHSRLEEHVVTREVPPISNAEPGPGLEATNPLPSTRSVKPFAPPA